MIPWEGILKIPEGKSGEYAITHQTHPAGTVLSTSNLRTALMGGHAGEDIHFENKSTWHELSYDHGVWMTDLPIEQAQCDAAMEEITGGSVLVGGLGLGYCLEVLARNDDVDDIEVVECSQEVAELVWPHVSELVKEKTDLHVKDLFDFLKEAAAYPCAHWDYAFYDIWQADSLHTFFGTVLPLRELSDGHVDEVICWNEDVMRGQLMTSLLSRIMATQMPIPGEKIKLTIEILAGPPPFKTGNEYMDWGWARPFWKTLIERGVKEHGEEFQALAGIYCRTLGRADWDLVKEHFHAKD